jgi:hypothetical protein
MKKKKGIGERKCQTKKCLTKKKKDKAGHRAKVKVRALESIPNLNGKC